MCRITQYNSSYDEVNSNVYFVFCFFVSLLYAGCLASLDVDAFVDRGNYLVYAEHSFDILSNYMGGGVKTVLSNEPAWLVLNVFLSGFLSPEYCIRVIIFFSSFTICNFVTRVNPRFFLVLLFFLLLPQVLKNNIIHLRQGLAISVFVVGWLSKNKLIQTVFIFLAPFFHASFFFIIFYLILSDFLTSLRFSSGLRSIIYLAVGLFFGLFGIWLAAQLGARQGSEYASVGETVSGLAFVFWFFISGLFFLEGEEYLIKNDFQFSTLILYLSTYFFLPVTARVFESCMLLILISGLGLSSWRRVVFLTMCVLYFLLQWYPRLYLAGFGWGVENYN